ncbi:hypothetical protein TTHERM_00160830 (macronuclear) [Tetrahymena thermophila SB210]|uniref:Uncharacterized protein n=1 Tax=Tetrahymena thermophila (strain SB210) TaxID=312017 RepID=Q22W49_TETTS|nr:hypothetical protein TTHERM_00160830 [Tetrahymena thermophila SB210]EAR89568.1 hypothetical protein TTHERM_00160830 [Tetrahymena thermophila SB210]|eukprot:XP_001009813.1 hypothetical protein TTHERM_00160830 [Tetrahymena thermophila SB210]
MNRRVIKSQSIERQTLTNMNVSNGKAQVINKAKVIQPTSTSKSLSTTEFNWAPTTVKGNPLGLKPPQQRNLHVLKVNSVSGGNSRELSSSSQKSNGLNISPVKTINNKAPIQVKGNAQVQKISDGNDGLTKNRASSANKIDPIQLKQKSLSEINKIEGFIEDQKAKIEFSQNQKNVKLIKPQQVNQPKVYSDTNLCGSGQNSILGNSTMESQDQENSIKSLNDLNEIDEVYEGIETPMNPRQVGGLRQKPVDGFGEQEELLKMINAMEEVRNQNKTLEEIQELEQKKEQLRLLREKQLRELQGEVQEKTFSITFLRNEMNFRNILRDKFANNKYTNIDIIFEDDEVQLTDCVLFESQNDSLKQLKLSFSNANNFNEETLGAVKYIKLRNLQNLILNFARSRNTKQMINYSLFNLAYIPRVEINFSPNDQLIYYKQEQYIPIDYSNFQISVRDLQKLNRHLIEFQTTHLSFKLNENTYLSTATEDASLIRNPNKRRTVHRRQSQLYTMPHQIKAVTPIHQIPTLQNEQILKEIGHIFAKLKNIKISFKNCNLAEVNVHSFVTGLLETNSNEGEQLVGVFGNNFLETLEINLEGNHAIQEGFFQMFKAQNFKKLNSLTLIFDKSNQILRQYEQYNAFHFISYLKHVNHVKFITNFDQVIYEHNLSYSKVYLSISYLDISPFQLVDIQKAINFFKNTIDLTLDMSNNYKLPYKIIKSFFNELQCLKNSVKRLHFNLQNSNISEVEFICLYLSVSHIPHLTVKYDFELSNLLRITDSYSRLFLHHLGENILDKEMYRIKFTYLLNLLKQNPYSFTHAAINFYYNYGLTPELFEEQFKPFLIQHNELVSLNLDFNYCCFQPDQVLQLIETVLSSLQVNQQEQKPFTLIKLSFLNNHQVSLENLMAVFKKFLRVIPQLQGLQIITDQYFIEKLNQKPIVVQNLTINAANLKINKLQDIQLVAKKLYVAKRIMPEKDEMDQEENIDGEEMTQSMLMPKLFDLNVPPRVKKVLQSTVKPIGIITYEHENPAISQVSLQKNIKELAKNHPYEQVLVLCETYANELEELHSSTKKLKK